MITNKSHGALFVKGSDRIVKIVYKHRTRTISFPIKLLTLKSHFDGRNLVLWQGISYRQDLVALLVNCKMEDMEAHMIRERVRIVY